MHMIYRQKVAYGTYALVALLLITGVFVYIRFRGVSASEQEQYGKKVWEANFSEDLNGDKRAENFTLIAYKNGNERRSVLNVKDGLFKTRSVELTGFEEDLALCPTRSAKLPSGKYLLCIFGEVGVHSRNIQILDWDTLKTVKFIDSVGNLLENVASDVPDFVFANDGSKISLSLDNRNYEKNPLTDIVRLRYELQNNEFKYIKSEYIANGALIR